MRSKKFLNIQNSNSSNILLSMSGFPGHKAGFWVVMGSLESELKLQRSLNGKTEMQGQRDAESQQFRWRNLGRAGPQMRLTFRVGGHRLWAGTSYTWQPRAGNEVRACLGIMKIALGRKEEQRKKNVTTASMDHETAKAPLSCWDILWAPLVGDPLLWDWRQQDAGGEVCDGGQSSSPCGSASSGKWVGNADSWAPRALHRISESWRRA